MTYIEGSPAAGVALHLQCSLRPHHRDGITLVEQIRKTRLTEADESASLCETKHGP